MPATSYPVIEEPPFQLKIGRHCVRPQDNNVIEFPIFRTMDGGDDALRTMAPIRASVMYHCVDVASDHVMRDNVQSPETRESMRSGNNLGRRGGQVSLWCDPPPCPPALRFKPKTIAELLLFFVGRAFMEP